MHFPLETGSRLSATSGQRSLKTPALPSPRQCGSPRTGRRFPAERKVSRIHRQSLGLDKAPRIVPPRLQVVAARGRKGLAVAWQGRHAPRGGGPRHARPAPGCLIDPAQEPRSPSRVDRQQQLHPTSRGRSYRRLRSNRTLSRPVARLAPRFRLVRAPGSCKYNRPTSAASPAEYPAAPPLSSDPAACRAASCRGRWRFPPWPGLS